ncbi:hypothetical protein R3P38DRAFT_2797568 [Favolaschia claudopus]|uniref:Uncharacterized protein n=1 Tax=Favolaschia claudopus TaxID=2862362 RepID=A0AAW0A2I9_9AGAR
MSNSRSASPTMPPLPTPSMRHAHATRFDPSLPMTPEAAGLLRILCPPKRTLPPPDSSTAEFWGDIPNLNSTSSCFSDDTEEANSVMTSFCQSTPKSLLDSVVVEDSAKEEGNVMASDTAGTEPWPFAFFPVVEQDDADAERSLSVASDATQLELSVFGPFAEDGAGKLPLVTSSPPRTSFIFNPFSDEDDDVNSQGAPGQSTDAASPSPSVFSSYLHGDSSTSEYAESPETSLTSISASGFPSFYSPLCEAPVDPLEDDYLVWVDRIHKATDVLSLVTSIIDTGIRSPSNAYTMARIAARLAFQDHYPFAAQLGWEAVRRFIHYWQDDGKWLLECLPCTRASSSVYPPGAGFAIFLAHLLQHSFISPLDAHTCLSHILSLPHHSHSPCAAVILTAVRAFIQHSSYALVDWLDGEEFTLRLFHLVGWRKRDNLDQYLWAPDEKCAGLIKDIHVALYEKLLVLWNGQPGTGVA